jgi:hypothetical protein
METAVAFLVFCRPDCTQRIFERIRSAKPPRLYLIADGPITTEQHAICEETRNSVESAINWNCELIKVFSDTNLGCARRAQTGLDFVFQREEHAIILEDDTLPDLTFFKFCEELLIRYKSSHSIFHISGMNMFPDLLRSDDSYTFSSIINMWGWATWARAWKHYDLQMEGWKKENKKTMLNKWCITNSYNRGMRKMFDLHCNNDDPWTWDYQWHYACWRNEGLAVTPAKNMVSNIGIGPNATHTITETPVSLFPEHLEAIEFPLRHPSTVERNFKFEKKYRKKDRTSFYRNLKNFLKNLPFFSRFRKLF